MEEVEVAAKAANASDFITAMPQALQKLSSFKLPPNTTLYIDALAYYRIL